MLLARCTANLLATSFALFAGAIGCGRGDETPPLAPIEKPVPDSGRPMRIPDSGYMQPVGTSCTESEMKPCKVLLPAHG